MINLADVDIRITTGFTSIFTDGRDTGAVLQTSNGGENFAWSGSNGQTLTIEFGTWNGSTFTADRAVKSAGLAFVNFGGAYDTASDQTITYLDASDSVLSTQVFVGGLTDAQASGGTEYFSGLISATSGGKPISSRPLIREATPPTDLPSRRRFVKSVKNENEGVNHLIFVGENNNSGVPQQTGRFERHLIFPVPTKAFSGPETRMPDCRLSSATRQALGQSEPEHGLPQARAVVAALEDLAFVRQ